MKIFQRVRPGVWAAFAVVLLGGAALRFYAVEHTSVWGGYRADGAQYFNYAYNLRHYGVYSRDSDSVLGDSTDPKPDSMRTPGYAFFLLPFAQGKPIWPLFRKIRFWQAGLGVFVVLGVFLVFRRTIPPALAVVVAALVALSPQEVNIANYILSENLFTPLLVAIFLALGWAQCGGRRFLWGMFLAGGFTAMAALTRPIMEYFLPLLLVMVLISHARKPAICATSAMVLGFALLWTPWMIRNHMATGTFGNDRLMLETIHQGMYPDMMYDGDPQTRRFPYRFDPTYEQTDGTLTAVLKDVWSHWKAEPGEELSWYLVGKPLQLWSWKMVAGTRDIFLYPTLISPYRNQGVFEATHTLMYGLHWVLLGFALIGCVFVLLPMAHRSFDPSALFLLRSVSLLLLYNTAILIIGAPYTRYSTPLLPFAFGMAVVTISVMVPWARRLRAESRERYFARRQ